MKTRFARTLTALSLALAVTATDAAVFHVAVRHPNADDENAGTPDRPFKTITKATTVVAPGDRVLIHTGIYREKVTIETSGTEAAPITFEAAPGAHVTVTGAEQLTEWVPEKDEPRVYSTAWPHRYIPWYEHRCHPHDDYHRMIGRAEQIHINQYALLQVLERSKLSRGTFFVDAAAKRLYVWDRANRKVTGNRCTVEASVRPILWTCTAQHIRIRGLRFRYAANRAQEAAVNIGGSDNLIEHCVIERTNALGAVFHGARNIIRRCVFQDNGWDGFDAGGEDLLFTECLVRNNNTKDWNRDWGGGGNKIVFAPNMVIEKSTFVDNRGHGIWFDIGNEDCVVRNCLIANNENAGIFYEISYGLHAHDNVIVGNGLAPRARAWGANGGISISSSPGCLIERNLIVANKEGLQYREQTRTTPRIDDRKAKEPVWNHDITVRNNVIAYNRDAQTAGWFATGDERHWPANSARRKNGKPAAADALCLEKLNLTMRDNLYGVQPGQKLFQWGCLFPNFSAHVYEDLAQVREELGLEKGSRVDQLEFAGSCLTLDFRVDAGSSALKAKCYPQGDVPGVKLGVNQ